MEAVVNSIRESRISNDFSTILGFMKSFAECPDIVELSLNALRELSLDQEIRTSLQDGAMDAIVDALNSNSEVLQVQEAGVHLLWNLIHSEESMPWWKMKIMDTCEYRRSLKLYGLAANSRIIQVVISSMKLCIMNSKIAELGCFLLRLLARSHENEHNIAAAGGLEVILDAMKKHSDSQILEQACRALSNLAVNEVNKTKISELGGIEIILSAMNVEPQLATVQQWACGALANLAADDDIEVKIGTLGGLDQVLNAMNRHQESHGIQEEATAALCNLTVANANKTRMLNAGGINILFRIMSLHPAESEIQENCCSCIRNLADNLECRTAVINAGAVQSILRAMTLRPNEARVQWKACQAITSLAPVDSVRHQILDQGGLDCILSAMRQHACEDLSVAKCSCYALRKVLSMPAPDADADAVAAAAGPALHVMSLGAVEAVLLAMAHHPRQVPLQEQACALLITLESWHAPTMHARLGRSTWSWLRARELSACVGPPLRAAAAGGGGVARRAPCARLGALPGGAMLVRAAAAECPSSGYLDSKCKALLERLRAAQAPPQPR